MLKDASIEQAEFNACPLSDAAPELRALNLAFSQCRQVRDGGRSKYGARVVRHRRIGTASVRREHVLTQAASNATALRISAPSTPADPSLFLSPMRLASFACTEGLPVLPSLGELDVMTPYLLGGQPTPSRDPCAVSTGGRPSQPPRVGL